MQRMFSSYSLFFRVRFDIMKMNFFRKLYFDTKKQAIKSVKVLIFLRLLELLPSS